MKPIRFLISALALPVLCLFSLSLPASAADAAAAQIGETVYASFDDAVRAANAAASEVTIVLKSDVSVTKKTAFTKAVTLTDDGTARTVTFAVTDSSGTNGRGFQVNSGGSLTLTGSSTGGLTFTGSTAQSTLVAYKGTLCLENVTLSGISAESGALVQGLSSQSSHGSLTLTGVRISGCTCPAVIQSKYALTMTDCSLSGNETADGTASGVDLADGSFALGGNMTLPALSLADGTHIDLLSGYTDALQTDITLSLASARAEGTPVLVRGEGVSAEAFADYIDRITLTDTGADYRFLIDSETGALAALDIAYCVTAAAYAYLDQGTQIQYDQLNERRMLGMSPDDACAERTAYLDCSGFVTSVYRQVFGDAFNPTSYANTTYGYNAYCSAGIVKGYRPVIVHCDCGTDDGAAKLAELQEKLQVGDLINYRHKSGKSVGGHVMLYLGNGQVIHCTGSSFQNTGTTAGSYDAAAGTEADAGAVITESTEMLFSPSGKRYLLGDEITSFSLLRPANRADAITALGEAVTARCSLPRLSVEKSADCGAYTAVAVGDTVTYTVTVRNCGSSAITRDIVLADTLPENTVLSSGSLRAVFDGLAGGESASFSYTVRLLPAAAGTVLTAEGCGVFARGGCIRSNAVTLTCCPVFSSGAVTAALESACASAYSDDWAFASAFYRALGCDLAALTGFSSADAALTAADEAPDRVDTLLPGFYGGNALPDGADRNLSRVRQVRAENLMPGDLLLLENPAFSGVLCCLYVGSGEVYALGSPDEAHALSAVPASVSTADTKPSDRQYNSLFDRLPAFSRFAVLRPAMKADTLSYTLTPDTLTLTACHAEDPLLFLAEYAQSGQLLRVQTVTVGGSYALTGAEASLFLLDRERFSPLQRYSLR